ncbi:type II secretion system protein [Moritella yayanosii]|uniref:MSHA pilin protein MshA n=1 Tax=Moritella yayanosii TaxID=69539 RepID=A0A330LUJ8_9GAMM|nr:type II secretion system protein [Moritella yayanosii]SQD79681.1 MSHA pilin protein MshA [Moritella yayanosii]
MKRNAGFTLIELVIVIIVLGILAATAVPKFINLQDDAKESTLKGVEAALHSAANIVYSKAAINGEEAKLASTSAANGTGVATVYGFPAATDVKNSIELSGFKSKAGTPTNSTQFYLENGASSGNCTILYTQATSTASGTGYKIGFGDTGVLSTPTCG